jgi:hypothetical protein
MKINTDLVICLCNSLDRKHRLYSKPNCINTNTEDYLHLQFFLSSGEFQHLKNVSLTFIIS